MNLKNIGKQISEFFKRYRTLLVLVIACAVIAISNDVFLTQRNITNILRQAAISIILASGFTLMLTSGSLDLSIGSVMTLSALFLANMMKAGVPIWLAIILTLLIGACRGLITSLIVTMFNLKAFIVTLAMATVYRGFAWLYSEGVPVWDFGEQFTQLGSGFIGEVPIPIIIMSVVAVIVSIILNRTKFGRQVTAVGGNIEAARVSGLKVKLITIGTFMFTSMTAALAGVILVARMDQAHPNFGTGVEMDIIAGVVIGGTSFAGGRGTILGSIIGVMIMAVINNGLVINGVSPYITMISKGVLILVAIIIDKISTETINRQAKAKAAAEHNQEEESAG